MRTDNVARLAILWGTGLAAIGLPACQPTWENPRVHPPTVVDLPIHWEASGSYSQIIRPARLVVRDPGTLARLALCEATVDFGTQMVLVSALGPSPKPELGVRIQRVWQEGSVIRVQERQIYPGSEPDNVISPASPWTLVVIDRSDLNVEGYTSRVPKNLLGKLPGDP